VIGATIGASTTLRWPALKKRGVTRLPRTRATRRWQPKPGAAHRGPGLKVGIVAGQAILAHVVVAARQRTPAGAALRALAQPPPAAAAGGRPQKRVRRNTEPCGAALVAARAAVVGAEPLVQNTVAFRHTRWFEKFVGLLVASLRRDVSTP
jgi:branched-subunit amino acid ABC-type transport system permease component